MNVHFINVHYAVKAISHHAITMNRITCSVKLLLENASHSSRQICSTVSTLFRCFIRYKILIQCLVLHAELSCYKMQFNQKCDRQSQTNLFDRTPDISRHPNLTKLRGLTTIVRPGDTVFIPAYWFHEIVSLADQDQQNTINVSLSFWFQVGYLGSFV